MTVLVGALTSGSNPAFLIVVVAACLSAGMCWAISRNAGLVATASCVVLVTCPAAPDGWVRAARRGLATAAGLLQVVLVAAWPPAALEGSAARLRDAYGWWPAVPPTGRRTDAELDATALVFDLRAAYVLTESQARRRPGAPRPRALPNESP